MSEHLTDVDDRGRVIRVCPQKYTPVDPAEALGHINRIRNQLNKASPKEVR